MIGVVVMAFVVGIVGWCLMLAVGIFYGAGALTWTLSYDEACAISALVVFPLLMLGAVLSGFLDAPKGSG